MVTPLTTCQACGNDDACHHLCSDCLAPTVDAVAAALAAELGGEPADWDFLARSVAARLA